MGIFGPTGEEDAIERSHNRQLSTSFQLEVAIDQARAAGEDLRLRDIQPTIDRLAKMVSSGAPRAADPYDFNSAMDLERTKVIVESLLPKFPSLKKQFEMLSNPAAAKDAPAPQSEQEMPRRNRDAMIAICDEIDTLIAKKELKKAEDINQRLKSLGYKKIMHRNYFIILAGKVENDVPFNQKKALQHAVRVRAEYPENGKINLMIGRFYTAMGMHAEAMDCYKVAMADSDMCRSYKTLLQEGVAKSMPQPGENGLSVPQNMEGPESRPH